MKNNEIKVPESIIIEQFSHQLAELINKTPLSLQMKIYILKDVMEEMIGLSRSITAKEVEDYNNYIKQLEQEDNQEAE